MSEEQEKKIPKKRGRKPKKKEIVNENPEFTNKNISENLIIKLNKNTNDIDIEAYDINYSEDNYKSENNKNVSCVCWNCCHKFHNVVQSIPIKYVKPVFYTYGDFCSLECGMRYVHDNFKCDKWEIYSLINFYNNKILNNSNKINIPLSRLSLELFGGTLTIEEYRSKFNNIGIHELVMPQIIPINHEIKSYEKLKSTTKDLRLYRKKPLKNDKNKISSIINND